MRAFSLSRETTITDSAGNSLSAASTSAGWCLALREGIEELAEIDVWAAGLQCKGPQERKKILTVHGRMSM